MLKLLILIFGTFTFGDALKTYNGYKVFSITPKIDEQLDILHSLGYGYDEYQYWKEPTRKLRPVHLMVSPRKLDEFLTLMNVTQMNYKPYIEDVQALIDKQNVLFVKENEESFSWTRYHTYDEINFWLDSLASAYKEVELVIGGMSYEGREIKGVKVSFSKPKKPAVFIEGGIHANEWLGPATVTYLLDQFLNSEDVKVRELATSYDWYFFPICNPDGYVYSFQKDRLWRKTRVPNGNGCYGVDPNRNWDHQWMNGGASNDPCHENFAGKKPFSEEETKTLSKFLSSISNELFAFVSFHTYGQHLLLPYGHTIEHLDNYDDLYAIGKETINALSNRYGTIYDVGNIPEVLYIDSGSSMDWVKGVFKVPITYTYELRDEGHYGFLAPGNIIIPNGREVLDSLIVLFQESSKLEYIEKLNF